MSATQSLVKWNKISHVLRYPLWFRGFVTLVNKFPLSTAVFDIYSIVMQIMWFLEDMERMWFILICGHWGRSCSMNPSKCIHVNILLWFFFHFSCITTKYVIAIIHLRMWISRRLLPRVVEVLWQLAKSWLCKPWGERSGRSHEEVVYLVQGWGITLCLREDLSLHQINFLFMAKCFLCPCEG